MIVMIKEPDLRIPWILFKRNCIAITDLQNAFLAILPYIILHIPNNTPTTLRFTSFPALL